MIIDFQAKDSKEFAISLFDLETALAPTMLLLAGRAAVLVPIKAIYADGLLGTSEQISLFPKRKAMSHLRELPLIVYIDNNT